MSNSYGKRYAAEFKRDAVVLVKSSPGRTVSGIARELGVSPEGLRGWVKQARVDAGGGTPSSLTSAGREELAALRRRVREQDQVINILKKSRGLIRAGQPVDAVYLFIHAEKAEFPTALLCRTLGVHRSACYMWLAGRAARLALLRAEELLAAEITLIHTASRGAYGAPRVRAELRRRGKQVNRKKVERIMRERGIAGITRRRRSGLTRPERKAVFAPT